jgi:hypothetical protein
MVFNHMMTTTLPLGYHPWVIRVSRSLCRVDRPGSKTGYFGIPSVGDCGAADQVVECAPVSAHQADEEAGTEQQEAERQRERPQRGTLETSTRVPSLLTTNRPSTALPTVRPAAAVGSAR